jgi:hypothetical protein
MSEVTDDGALFDAERPLESAVAIKGDRADILYRQQQAVKDTMAAIIKGNHQCGHFGDSNWHHRAANEVFGYIDRVLRHQRSDGGRPGNGGRGR